jgi:tetratricopeptide (TPR) repeat protein
MAVADLVGVPVRPKLYEGHIAVCLEVQGHSFPIEISRGGAILVGRVADKMYSGKGKGRVLTNAQLLAVNMSNQAAFVYAPQGEYKTAYSLLKCALEYFPEYIAAWINLAALFIRLDELDEAVDSLERVMNLSPSGPYLKHALAMREHIVQGRMPNGHHIA